jgi:hypothetical protein
MKKRIFNIAICLLISLLASECAPNEHVVEENRIAQPTVSTTQSATPSIAPDPPTTPFLAYPPEKAPTPLQTSTFTETPFIQSTQSSPTLTSQQVADKIAACYHVGADDDASWSILNNSIQHVVQTTRMFINVPKDLYPKELFRYATTITGNATIGWISNGGLPGLAMDGGPECWSTYVEFDGQGEIDLRIPSILIGVPDYYVQFVVD